MPRMLQQGDRRGEREGLVLHVLQRLADLCLDLIAEFLVVFEKLFCGLASLGEFLVAVAEP